MILHFTYDSLEYFSAETGRKLVILLKLCEWIQYEDIVIDGQVLEF